VTIISYFELSYEALEMTVDILLLILLALIYFSYKMYKIFLKEVNRLEKKTEQLSDVINKID
jgi:hypothetical protein